MVKKANIMITIERLKLHNFRRFQEFEVKLNKDTNVFKGS